MTTKSISPCLHCTKVRDPNLCENKSCKLWSSWFIGQWETTRRMFRRPLEQAQLQECGVPLGGHRYCSPHQMRNYLQHDPCDACLYPTDLCGVPCPARLHWQTCRKEQSL